ncbi:hypothetical protein KUCAC02_024233, partial [Chaenocephalus aceratus]
MFFTASLIIPAFKPSPPESKRAASNLFNPAKIEIYVPFVRRLHRDNDVIHTVGPVARGHVGPTESNDLTSCYQNSLRLMKENDLSTV